jgi:sensor histidine kinase YesM
VNENIDLKSAQVPALIIQPFIENAVWHGIVPRGSGIVGLSVLKENGDIQVIIEDDGIGREASRKIKARDYHAPVERVNLCIHAKIDNLLQQRRPH